MTASSSPRTRADWTTSDSSQATLNQLLFPGPTKEFLESRERYGDVSRARHPRYLYGLQPGEEHDGRDRQGGKR